MNMLGIVVAFATAVAAVYVWVAPRRRSPPPSGSAAFVDPDAEASQPTDEGIPHPAAHAGD